MGRPIPSPIKMSLEPLYGEWRERCHRSIIIWWETPLSRSHDEGVVMLGALVATLACGGHGVGEIKSMAMEEGVECIVVNWKKGHRFACSLKYHIVDNIWGMAWVKSGLIGAEVQLATMGRWKRAMGACFWGWYQWWKDATQWCFSLDLQWLEKKMVEVMEFTKRP